ncbi:MAG: 23S rRNA (guanosine(2251)-2'-O)-methyltransferase RlmB [Actinomycetaceae bacterium]|nr:23S rRNA (guanosine(2251)-2'-O)-methyltransferase RlmB [Actinomycetaceae bacterium]
MADNQHQRSRKKSSSVGSGGKRARGLKGKGPTPKAEDRIYHPAHQRKIEREVRKRKQMQRENSVKARKGSITLRDGSDFIVGRNAVTEAVRGGIPFSRIFLQSSLVHDSRLSLVLQEAVARHVPVVEVSRSDLDALSDSMVHQGIGIEVPPYEYADITSLVHAKKDDGVPGFFVALDGITDPHNLGSIVRSACAFYADGVIIPERRSCEVNSVVWKVSSGGAARLPIAREKNLVRTLEYLKSEGYFVVGLDGGGSQNIGELSVADMPLVVVTGSEGKGLSQLTRKTCDVIASIPISPLMESLNAGVATGVALYQIHNLRTAKEN